MKKLIALMTFCMAASAAATPWFITNGEFKGKGVWKDAKGAEGTYQSSLAFKENRATRTQFGEITLAGSTKVMRGEEVIMEERGAYNWRFTGWGRFLVIEGDKVIGQGTCAFQKCSYTYTEGKECGGETLTFRPKKNMIRVRGNWCDEESRGAYAGYLCRNCEDNKKD